ncbi:MAG: helix-turn-helix transcriptional regulator [Actinomycetota bacterium]
MASVDLHADPHLAAEQLLSRAPDGAWLDAFLERAASLRRGRSLGEVLDTWGLSQAEFASLVGISRQAVAKWLTRLPSDREVMVANLAAATDVLVHYVRRERIPAVVRRQAPGLENRSLVDLIAGDETAQLLRVTRQMFDPAGAST